jgi:hypothetical protein
MTGPLLEHAAVVVRQRCAPKKTNRASPVNPERLDRTFPVAPDVEEQDQQRISD